jgi:hypothetical protein
MSRKHRHECGYEEKCCYEEKSCHKDRDNCCCSFPTLVILILIILQFSKNGHGYFGGAPVADGIGNYGGFFGGITDNSILFIIALFFLACCNPCKRLN